jgi:UDP-glucose 4-epimerase
VFVGDVARAAEACVSNDCPGVFNIGTGRETSVNQLVAALTGAVGEKGNISNGEAKGGEQQRSCIDPSRAKATLGWQPQVALEEGVRRTVDWFRENV